MSPDSHMNFFVFGITLIDILRRWDKGAVDILWTTAFSYNLLAYIQI